MPDNTTRAGQAIAARIARLSELDHLDSIGTHAIQKTAAELQRDVPGLYDSVALKVSRAVVDRLITPGLVGEKAAISIAKHRAGRLRVPVAGYFTSIMQREFAKAGIPWDEGGPST